MSILRDLGIHIQIRNATIRLSVGVVLHVLEDVQSGHTKRVVFFLHPDLHIFRPTYFRKRPNLLSIAVESGRLLADLL